MQNRPTRFTNGSRLRTGLMGIGVLVVAGIGVISIWWANAMRTPVVTIPNPILPQPNAFDFYVKAGNTIVNDKQIGDAFGVKPTVTYSTAQKEALIQANVSVINTVHQGFAYSYHNPPIRSFDASFPYYARFRALTRLLSLRAQARAERGDWSGAADSDLDAVRLGEDVPYGSPTIGDLVGIACQAIGRRQLWNTVEHLNAAQTRSVMTRLTGILEHHLPYSDSVHEEKWTVQAGLLEAFNNPEKLKALTATESDDPKKADKAEQAEAKSILFYLTYSKRRIMGDYSTYMDALADQARKPYGLHLPPPPMPTDPINRDLLPIYSRGRLKDVDGETQNKLLLVTLALHGFQLEHGHYPASLSELAPAYLQKLPDDPFAAQGTFKYIVQGKSYVLYSVGPDGKDDGGRMIDDPKHPESPDSTSPNARYFVWQNSVGDIVAGKSFW
ncbi:MAG: hypothetical protein JWN14_4127 [Chthonomonadales bacterium]|nr:hypothetical protein [Chthonomonadales bacterium]